MAGKYLFQVRNPYLLVTWTIPLTWKVSVWVKLCKLSMQFPGIALNPTEMYATFGTGTKWPGVAEHHCRIEVQTSGFPKSERTRNLKIWKFSKPFALLKWHWVPLLGLEKMLPPQCSTWKMGFSGIKLHDKKIDKKLFWYQTICTQVTS